VSGSDISDSDIIKELRELGAEIIIGQKISEIPKDADLIVYSAAIPVAEPELFKEIKKLKIKSISYAEALGEISRGKKTIAVSGTHGKTTTTAMLANILIDAGLNPTVIVGSLMKDKKTGKQTNFIFGDSNLFVVEADEYQRSFLNLAPVVLVITNIDADHLDYYRDISDIQSAFSELVKKVPKEGAVVTNFSNTNVVPVIKSARALALDYNSADARGLNLRFPGEHNRENARAALTAAAFLGVKQKVAIKSLNDFEGTWRRFEYKGETARGALVYDDYAHNPQKVRAVLSGAREKFPDKKIIAVFQPHLFSRTKTLFNEFAESFSDANEIVLLPIFPAREKFDPTISSEMLAEKIAYISSDKRVNYFGSFEKTKNYLKDSVSKDSVIFTIGAGDVYKIASAIVE
jgi:UDP-N-acetylmuramate--alanine ligase